MRGCNLMNRARVRVFMKRRRARVCMCVRASSGGESGDVPGGLLTIVHALCAAHLLQAHERDEKFGLAQRDCVHVGN